MHSCTTAVVLLIQAEQECTRACVSSDELAVTAVLKSLISALKSGKDTKPNKATQTNEDREVIVHSDREQLQLGCELHKTRRQTQSKLDADLWRKQWKRKKGLKKIEEGEGRPTVCRWFIIVVAWRGFC